jgi:outer membrane protein
MPALGQPRKGSVAPPHHPGLHQIKVAPNCGLVPGRFDLRQTGQAASGLQWLHGAPSGRTGFQSTENSMTQLSLIALATTALVAALPAQAQDTGSFIVRARAVHLESANKDSTGLGLTINNKWLPEVDFTYFLSPNLAAELILTIPQKQTVYSNGADIGTFKHLPPTLTMQYHFTGMGFRPYLGAGVNYTNLSAVHILNGAVNLKRNSYGLALQAGVDIPLGGGWLINADVKKVQIGTHVYVGTADAGKFKVDPVLFGIGVGKRF